MAYDLIKISGLPLVTPDSGQDIVVGVGDLAKRINYGDVKADMVGISPSYTTDTEPYLMRQTAHVGVVGKCALEKLVGGSLAWNQMIPHTASTGTSAGITFTNNGDGSWTLTGTATNNNAFINLDAVVGQNKFIANHVYLFMPNQSGATTFTKVGLRMYGLKDTNSPYETYVPYIVKCSATPVATGYTRMQVTDANGINIGTVKLTPQVFDLTQMFGPTIADYIVNLGQTDGLAWLSKYIDLSTYHAYDAGSIQSVQATAHVTTGKNLMPQQTDGIIPCFLPKGAHICASCTTPTGATPNLNYYDANCNRIDYWPLTQTYSGGLYRSFVVAQDAYYIAFTNNTAQNKQLEFGTAPTAYEPYTEHVYPLGSDTLRGIPQLVSNKLQFDGDEKYPDGTIKRKYGSRAYQSGDTSDGATMITDGTTTVYKLATPTTESSTAFQKVQTIDADGTESFTTSSPVPVGHETQTPDNILAALEWLGE